jgi:hypothetical protein
MMKEHVRGPIKWCETLAADICLQIRAEELVYNEHFHPAEVTKTTRGREDKLGGKSPARVLGSPCIHTPLNLLREMLRRILDETVDIHEGGWEPDDHQHEDFVIHEYTNATVGASTNISVDWNSVNRATSDYYVYWSYARKKGELVQAEMPIEPSMEKLQSMDKPPTDFIHDMQDYYNHHSVGKV